MRRRDPSADALERRVFDVEGQQHLVGRRRAEVVVEADERREELGVGELLARERERAARRQLAAADRHDDELERDALAVKADDVLVAEVRRHDPLLLERHLERAHLVADVGRHLEVGARRGVLHAHAQAVHELVALAVEEEADVAHLLGVGFARDRQHAGRGAALDLVLQAGAAAVVQDVVGARAQLEVAVDDAQRLPAGGRRVVRAEVGGAVVAQLAHDLEAGPLGGGVEAQHEVIFVVLEVDVEARLMLLDERVLEEQRLLLVRGDDRLDVGDDALEQRHEVAAVARGRLEVLAHAVAQHGGFADVHGLAAVILHDVDAGGRGQALEDLGERLALGRDLALAQRRRGGLGRLRRELRERVVGPFFRHAPLTIADAGSRARARAAGRDA